MKIKSINIRNFRKLLDCTLDIGKEHTVLVGANNSGKTSCMHAVVSFLKDPGRFSTKDFTLTNWESINEVVDGWVNSDRQKPQLSDLLDHLPQMDIWITVDDKETYLVKDLIPSLDWEGKENSIDRTARLFYVTCTRAEESLAILMYTGNPEKAKETAINNNWFKENEIDILT